MSFHLKKFQRENPLGQRWVNGYTMYLRKFPWTTLLSPTSGAGGEPAVTDFRGGGAAARAKGGEAWPGRVGIPRMKYGMETIDASLLPGTPG
eukprot:1772029-Rhodomonas_salina.1